MFLDFIMFIDFHRKFDGVDMLQGTKTVLISNTE